MLTYITTYYNNPQFLDTLQETMTYCQDERLKMIIVDDGSTEPIDNIIAAWSDPRVSLYRITEDVGFNSHGARNLAMKHTTTKWNLLIDIDYRLVGVDNILSMIENDELEENVPHFFRVAHTYDGEEAATRASINDFLVTGTTYWKAGGYDPEYYGFHYGDRKFIDRMLKLTHGRQNSILFDTHLEAMRSPFAITKVDDSITSPTTERYSEDRTILYQSPLAIEALRQQELLCFDRHKSGTQPEHITFQWIKQL